MAVCTNCGHYLTGGAKFCPECGSEITDSDFENNTAQRRQTFIGEIRKCPNCGEVLKSFTAICPACGYEIQNIDVASSVRTLTERLEQIEARRLTEEPDTPISPLIITEEAPNSFMKKVLGWDFNENKRREAAREAMELEEKARKRELRARKKAAKAKVRRFETQKQREKAELIRNFPIPNTKEDILEFTLLASSNIKIHRGIKDVVTKAWISKLDQVYKKAEISFGTQSDFEQIQDIYNRTTNKIHAIRVIKRGLLLLTFLAILFLFAFRTNPDITILISVIAMIVVVLGTIGFCYWRKKQSMRNN